MGIKVRGQRTKSSGRTGKTLGVTTSSHLVWSHAPVFHSGRSGALYFHELAFQNGDPAPPGMVISRQWSPGEVTIWCTNIDGTPMKKTLASTSTAFGLYLVKLTLPQLGTWSEFVAAVHPPKSLVMLDTVGNVVRSHLPSDHTLLVEYFQPSFCQKCDCDLPPPKVISRHLPLSLPSVPKAWTTPVGSQMSNATDTASTSSGIGVGAGVAVLMPYLLRDTAAYGEFFAAV